MSKDSETEPHFPASRSEWLRFVSIVGQLGLILLAIDTFQIESRAFASLAYLVTIGFVIHALLPLWLRLPFFALLSLAAIGVILGPHNAVWVIGLGSGLIVLCCLPISLLARAGLLLSAGALLAAMRADWLHAPWSSAIWPVLGSLFMFRTMMFLYDRHHGERPKSIWETLSYFFLLPNVCFPLFPLVDYATFRRTYQREYAWDCYQTGVRWITRGLLHLVLYRLVYYHGLLASTEVASVGDLARYLVATISLYLRVSGVFHLAVGILRLFGFGLPETHFLYFLCGSINDFWRRANIYWKDFMLKLFYLPAFFKLRKSGEKRALVLSTMIVVGATWVLHSYQWFWLRGAFPVKWQDGVFWATLGLLMVINTLHEQKKSRARGRHARSWTLRRFLGQSARIVGTFAVLSTLWSLWTCESFGDWLGMWTLPGRGTVRTGSTPFADTAVMFLVLAALCAAEAAAGKTEARGSSHASFFRSVSLTCGALLGLLLLGTPAFYTGVGGGFSEIVQSLRVAKLNRLDTESLQRGYYEDLLDVDRFNSELWRVYKSKPADWLELRETPALQPTGDFQLSELKPSMETPYKGATLSINRWGMRDRDYTLEKPANTHRTAVFGASYVMGSGVENDEIFEAVIEARLNAEGPGAPERNYEVLNFAVAGQSPLQRLGSLQQKALRFSPDVAAYIAHENETYRLIRHLHTAHTKGIEVPDEDLGRILDRAGVDASMAADTFESALEPHLEAILGLAYRRFVEACDAHGVRPVWILMPTLEMHGQPEEIAWMRNLAVKAGFAVIELFGVYDGHDTFAIRIADWDYHPNRLGHQLIADAIYDAMTALELFW